MKFKAIRARNKVNVGKVFEIVDGKMMIKGKEYEARVGTNCFGTSVCAVRFANGDARGGRIWFDEIEVIND